MMKKKSAAAVTTTIAVMALLSLSSAQLTLEPLRNRHLKQDPKGAPRIVQQVEFMKNLVDTLQDFIHSNQGHATATQVNTGTGDHLWQYLTSSKNYAFGDFVACQTCWYGTGEVASMLNSTSIVQQIESSLIAFCQQFSRWDVCSGFVNSFADLIIGNLLALNLRPDYLCTEAFEVCPQYDSSFVELNETTYQQQILSSKPADLANDDFIDKLYESIRNDPNRESRKTIKVVHFTDIHFDMFYTAGANKHCDNVICCRAEDGFPNDTSNQAGILGTFGCDIPFDTVTRMGEYINSQVKPDIIFWGGDVTPHDQYNYTYDYVTTLQTRLADFFKANLSDYVLYPLEGNHDFVTPNSQDFTKPDEMLAFNLKVWNQYLDPEAQAIYAKAGYYTQKLRVKNFTGDGSLYTFEKANLVAINTEAGYNMNFYLLSQRNDPGDMLAWLNATLAEFEARGEYAILMAHHPPGDADILFQWAARFRAILDRYQHIVRWSVYGHVHLEIYGVAKGIQTGKPTGVQYWTGSVSTWFEVNPSFKMFEVDVETMLPVRSHTYFLDIENHHNQSTLEWAYHHEVTAFYNMTDLSPTSFVQLAERVRESEQVALHYQSSQASGGNQTIYPSCDESCRTNLYCQMVNTVYFESKDCMGLPRYDIRNDPISTLMEHLSDPWVEKKASASKPASYYQ